MRILDELPEGLRDFFEQRTKVGPEWTYDNVQKLVCEHHKHVPLSFLRKLWDDLLEECKKDTYCAGLEPYGAEPIFSLNSKVPLRYAMLQDQGTYELVHKLVYETQQDPREWTHANCVKIAKTAGDRFTPPQVRDIWEEVKDVFPVNELTLKCVYSVDTEVSGDEETEYDPTRNPIHPYGSWKSVLGHACAEHERFWNKYKYLLDEEKKEEELTPANGKTL